MNSKYINDDIINFIKSGDFTILLANYDCTDDNSLIDTINLFVNVSKEFSMYISDHYDIEPHLDSNIILISTNDNHIYDMVANYIKMLFTDIIIQQCDSQLSGYPEYSYDVAIERLNHIKLNILNLDFAYKNYTKSFKEYASVLTLKFLAAQKLNKRNNDNIDWIIDRYISSIYDTLYCKIQCLQYFIGMDAIHIIKIDKDIFPRDLKIHIVAKNKEYFNDIKDGINAICEYFVRMVNLSWIPPYIVRQYCRDCHNISVELVDNEEVSKVSDFKQYDEDALKFFIDEMKGALERFW